MVHWRIDIDVECRLKASQDAFGNVVHGFTLDGPLEALAVTAIGEVETFDTRGVVNGAVERFPPELYLRPTPLDARERGARGLRRSPVGRRREGDARSAACAFAGFVPRAFGRAVGSGARSGSQSQDRRKRGTGRGGLAHLFIACARALEMPARYVAGYRLDETGTLRRRDRHGWAEGFVPGLGWVGFDASDGICPDERYVRVAIGLDSLGARAVRSAHAGGGEPVVKVKLAVTECRARF